MLHSFAGKRDGTIPTTGKLVFDAAGNLYGTTFFGGSRGCPVPHRIDSGCGIPFELSPKGGSWDEHVLYRFQNLADGVAPHGTLTILPAGRIVGVTESGGNPGCLPVWGRHGCGTVFALARGRDGRWTKQTLHRFTRFANDVNDGGMPACGLIADATGHWYGTTQYGGAYSPNGSGTVFQR